MNQGLVFGLTVAKSGIHGKGCFAAIPFCQYQKIAEYLGERIALAEAERRRCVSGDQYICDVDCEWAIDGSRGGNGTQYVNHSCQPNSYVIISQGRVFIHALRDIAGGEEITTDYLYELYSDQTSCCCRTAACAETTSLARIREESAEQASETVGRYFGQ